MVGSAAAAGVVSAPFVRRANAAATLTVGLWDHWVPGANDVQTAIIKEWGEKEKVEVNIDYITSQGNKLLLTLAAESQANSGHDIMEFTNWEAVQFSESLDPVDDVVKSLVAKNGPIDPAVAYLGNYEGKWLGVPMTRGTLLLGCCSRIDLMEHAGIGATAGMSLARSPQPRRGSASGGVLPWGAAHIQDAQLVSWYGGGARVAADPWQHPCVATRPKPSVKGAIFSLSPR